MKGLIKLHVKWAIRYNQTLGTDARLAHSEELVVFEKEVKCQELKHDKAFKATLSVIPRIS